MKTWYAAYNLYGSDCSYGFSNTWSVLAFNSKSARDQWLQESRNITTEAILKSEIKNYINAPKPFSYKRRAIDPYCSEASQIQGCLGEVKLMYIGEGYNL